MWLLECDGDLFQHKKIWLRPGKSYLFGRTKTAAQNGEQCYAISNKSVSRKHLIVTVSPVIKGEGSNVYSRSTVTISDESKVGTTLDDDRFIHESRTLTNRTHTIKLGSYEQIFTISWKPVVLTFSFTEKQQRGASDYLNPFREKMEPLDIKTIHTYLIHETTHLVSAKRNIPKGLQALINAKYIVTEEYVGAIAQAAVSPELGEDGAILHSPLETDLEGNWPNALKFLPGPGKEPIARRGELFTPDPNRSNVFEGYTFILADEAQFENLSPVINNGGGKAVKFNMKLGSTTVEEFVAYVGAVANKKGTSDTVNDESGNPVAIVRFRGKGNTAEWALNFLRELDLALGRRSAEQNELLDAILMNDPKILHRPLQEDETANSGAPSSTAVVKTEPDQESDRACGTARPSSTSASQRLPAENREPSVTVQADPSEPAHLQENTPQEMSDEVVEEVIKPSPSKHRLRRTVAQSRFKGFDDFDASQLPKHRREEDSDNEENMQVDSQPLFVSDSQPGGESQQSQSAVRNDAARDVTQEGTSNVNRGNIYDSLLPATAAMKRKRLEDERAGKASPGSGERSGSDGRPAPKVQKKRQKEIDVRSLAREHAEELDARRDGARKAKRRLAGDVNMPHADDEEGPPDWDPEEDISGLRNLAIVEEMDVAEAEGDSQRTRSARRGQARNGANNDAAASGRWDPRWNGRKNFKKFRRKGDGSNIGEHRAQKVIVLLEEAQRKDYGMGDDYWLESPKDRTRRQRDAASPSQTRQSTGRKSGTQSQREVIEVADDGENNNDDNENEVELNKQTPSANTRSGRGRSTGVTASQSQSPQQKLKTKGKRGRDDAEASQPSPSAKKQKQQSTQTKLTSTRSGRVSVGGAGGKTPREEDSDEEDELKFRRRKRR